MKQQILLIFLLISSIFLSALAAAADGDISPEDKAKFEKITEPITRFYNLVKYVATGIASLMLLFAGSNYITGGSDPKKREDAKAMTLYVVLGLVVIWAAPLVVEFIVG